MAPVPGLVVATRSLPQREALPYPAGCGGALHSPHTDAAGYWAQGPIALQLRYQCESDRFGSLFPSCVQPVLKGPTIQQ